MAYHALKNRADAEDVMQTTLLRLLEHRQPFESEEHMKHWLLRVAVNESRKLLRSFWRRHAVPLDEWRDAPVFQDPAQSELFQAVMALDAKYRLTIYLYYYEGCSVKEVAAGYECGMSIEKYNDIKEGDIFECFVMEQIKE